MIKLTKIILLSCLGLVVILGSAPKANAIRFYSESLTVFCGDVVLPPIYGHGKSVAFVSCSAYSEEDKEYQITISEIKPLTLLTETKTEWDRKEFRYIETDFYDYDSPKFEPNAEKFTSDDESISSWAIRGEFINRVADDKWHSSVGDLVHTGYGSDRFNLVIGIKAGKNAQMREGEYKGGFTLTVSSID